MSDTEAEVESQVPEVPAVTSFPGMIDKVVTELHSLTNLAQQGSDAVGIDRGAQALLDDLKGCYGSDVAEMFVLPTLDRLIDLGVAVEVDWERGKALVTKVQSYIALAEDFGLSPGQVATLNDSVTDWETFLPKRDRQQRERKEERKTTPDIPFSLRISYKGQELGIFGERNGEVYWSQTWNSIQKNHYANALHLGDKFSPEIRAAMKDGKEALLNGASAVQIWDYMVEKVAA